jgi:hypothetical protein
MKGLPVGLKPENSEKLERNMAAGTTKKILNRAVFLSRLSKSTWISVCI